MTVACNLGFFASPYRPAKRSSISSPGQVMLAAAHHDDLAAARMCGLRTGYIERPLEFGLIWRLFSYTRPYVRKRNALFALVVLRSIQLPTLAWMIGEIINGPITRHDVRGTMWGATAFCAGTPGTCMMWRSIPTANASSR